MEVERSAGQQNDPMALVRSDCAAFHRSAYASRERILRLRKLFRLPGGKQPGARSELQ
jgi:hypothetical protein